MFKILGYIVRNKVLCVGGTGLSCFIDGLLKTIDFTIGLNIARAKTQQAFQKRKQVLNRMKLNSPIFKKPIIL
jgi:dihydroxyacetone kinase-like predicted kinase